MIDIGPTLQPDLSHVDWSKVALARDTVPSLIGYCRKFGERELLVYDDDRLSYQDAIDKSADLAGKLVAAGIGKFERVGLLLPNGAEFIISWLAVARIGAVAVPISTLSTSSELQRIANHSSISLLISTRGYRSHDFVEKIQAALGPIGADFTLPSEAAPRLRQIWFHGNTVPNWAHAVDEMTSADSVPLALIEADVVPADPVSIIYTSGSTSLPKGVIHSHGTFLRSAQRWAASMDYRSGDRVFNTAPFFWVGGVVTTILTLMEVGATIIGTSQTGSALVDTIIKEGCTLLASGVHLSKKILSDPTVAERDFSKLRGGSIPALLPPHLRTRNQIYFGNALGMTETAGPHTLALPDVDDKHRGSMGPPAPEMEHMIIDVDTGAKVANGERGELLVRGNTLMIGYVGVESSNVFEPDGWFRTGDICSYRDGHLFFHGRRDDTIKSSGANVSPAEVEAALRGIEGIEDVFVLGLPDEERGQIVGALVVARAGFVLDPHDILTNARRLLSSYKVPRRLIILKEPPLTATQKLDRVRARELLLKDSASV